MPLPVARPANSAPDQAGLGFDVSKSRLIFVFTTLPLAFGRMLGRQNCSLDRLGELRVPAVGARLRHQAIEALRVVAVVWFARYAASPVARQRDD